MARAKHLEIGLDILPHDDDRDVYASSVSVIYPNNPERGRFLARGIVVGGLKSLLHRPVEIYMTKREAQTLHDELGERLATYPQTGTEIDVHTGGSHRAIAQ